MKHVTRIACSTLLIGLGAGPLAAQPVSVQITGQVVQWEDSTGLVGPYIPNPAPVTAIYTFDPSAPVTTLGYETYSLPASSASIVVNIGSLSFQTGPASRMEAQIYPGVPGSSWGQAEYQGYQNPPLPSGVAVDLISVNFEDPTGEWPTSTALPTGAPNLSSYAYSNIIIAGPNTATGNFQITVQITSVQLLPPSIEISPLTGSFIYQQHFDSGMLLPLGGAALATMQASIGGSPLTLSYPGTCQLATPTSAGRAALVCPGADAALASFQGVTQIDWLVTLADGSTYTKSVQWNLIH